MRYTDLSERSRPADLPPHPPLTDYYDTEDDRRRLVKTVFDEAAPYYDWVIRFMSFGSGARYRRDALARAGLTEGMKVLDVAIGTGAVARPAHALVGPKGVVVGIDPSTGMLAQTRQTLPIPLVQGIAEQLPFRSESFDFITMGYALRHVSSLPGTFSEYFRVLKPGGGLLILEFRRPDTRAGAHLVSFYLNRVIPLVAWIRWHSAPTHLLMKYCWATVETSVPPQAILESLSTTGFIRLRNTGWYGMLTEYSAVKP